MQITCLPHTVKRKKSIPLGVSLGTGSDVILEKFILTAEMGSDTLDEIDKAGDCMPNICISGTDAFLLHRDDTGVHGKFSPSYS
jgi:hypothetical protein